MSIDYTKGDLLPAYDDVLLSGQTPYDLSGCTVRFVAKNQSTGLELFDRAAIVVDAAAGQVRYEPAAGDTDTVGRFMAQFVAAEGGAPGLVVSSFKAYSTSQFVAAEGGGGSYLVANRTDANAWEQFVLVPQPGGGTALMASNGMYVAAEGGGNGEVNANRTTIGPWETFFLVDLGDGWVAWRTWNGYFLRADPNLAGRLDARGAPAPSGPGPWETFFRY